MTDNVVYLETLLKYYEEEVIGEAYFYGLADHIGGAVEREKLALLAEVERRAADVVRPLLVARRWSELLLLAKRRLR